MAYSNGALPQSHLVALPARMTNGSGVRWTSPGAAAALLRMEAAFRADGLGQLQLTDGYRSYSWQQRIFLDRYRPFYVGTTDWRQWIKTRYNRRLGTAAASVPGFSNHGTDDPSAIDFASGINSFTSAAHAWMKKNAWRFGFRHPSWAKQGGKTPEPWHWERATSWDPSRTEPVPFWRAVQITLQEQGHKIKVDGLPGPSTNRELEIYQTARGLVADHVAGPQTLALLGIDEWGNRVTDTTLPATVAEELNGEELEMNLVRDNGGHVWVVGVDRRHIGPAEYNFLTTVRGMPVHDDPGFLELVPIAGPTERVQALAALSAEKDVKTNNEIGNMARATLVPVVAEILENVVAGPAALDVETEER